MKNGKVMLHRLPEDIVPLSIHEDMGWISKPYEMIVALPVEMTISIEGSSENEKEDDEYDVIVY